MAFSVFTAIPITASAAETGSGKITDTIKWNYNNGTLTISGSGEMPNYKTVNSYYDGIITDVPWKDYLGNITCVIFSGSITSIGDCSFSDCSLLCEVSLSSSIQKIGVSAFARCTSLTDITLPFALTSIASGAFQGCSKLKKIDIPNSVTNIGSSAFQACNSLNTAILSASLTKISSSLFQNCGQLSNINIPDSVTSIGSYAFAFCNRINEVIISENVNSISAEAFLSCSSLKKVTIYNKSASFGTNVFGNCNYNLIIYGYLDSTTESYSEKNGHAFVALDADSAELNIKYFEIDKTSGQKLGTTINLTAKATGGQSPYQYMFYYKIDSGEEKTIKYYSNINNASFTLTKSGTYEFGVRVKDGNNNIKEKIITNYSVLGFTGFAGGAGTRNNPYKISDETMFEEISNYPNASFILMNNLDLSHFKRISKFNGIFDGNGHTIKINSLEENGLFDKVYDNANITNLNVNIVTNDSIGGIFGAIANENNGKISYCNIFGKIRSTNYGQRQGSVTFGGVSARNFGIITKCRSNLNMHIEDYLFTEIFTLGGICGCNYGTIRECLTDGEFYLSYENYQHYITHVGGITGVGDVENCAINTNMIVNNIQTDLGTGAAFSYGVFTGNEYKTLSDGLFMTANLDSISGCIIPDTFSLTVTNGYYYCTTIYDKRNINNVSVKSKQEIADWWENVLNEDNDANEGTDTSNYTFSLTGKQYYILGKEGTLNLSYWSSVDGEVLNELNNIKWTNSNPSVATVSNLDTGIADTKKNSVVVMGTVKALSVGSTIIEGTSPDGRIASFIINVSKSEDIDDYDNAINDTLLYEQYQAKYYSENTALITDTYMTYSEIEDNYTPTAYAINNILSFGWNKNYGFSDDAQVWEAVILDILFKNASSASTIESWEKDSLSLCKELCNYIEKNNIADVDNSITLDVQENLNTLVKSAEKTEGLTDSEETTAVFKKLFSSASTIKEFVDMYSKYINLRKIIDVDMKSFLYEMKNTDIYKDIPAFSRALDKVLANISAKNSALSQILVQEKVSNKIVSKAINEAVGFAVKVILGENVYKLIDITKTTTIHLMNTICGTDEKAQLNVYIYILDKIDNSASEAFNNVSQVCLASNGTNKFHSVNGGFQFMCCLYTYGISVCRNWSDVITINILSRIENGPYTTVNRIHYDVATAYLNLNHSSSNSEKKKFIEKKCNEDEQYVDVVLKNQPAFARLQWYRDSGTEQNESNCIVVFKVQNPNEGYTLYTQVVPKNTKVQFPKLESKNGYIVPTKWYTNEQYRECVDDSIRITENTVFYTRYLKNVLFEETDRGAKIISVNGVNAQKFNSVSSSVSSLDINQLNLVGASFNTNNSFEIPAYIDGYKVIELGDDIFASYSIITSVTIPKTIDTISNIAFKSCPDLMINGYEGSYAQIYAEKNNFIFNILEEIILGDVNGDGKIDIDDVTLIQKYIANMQSFTEEQQKTADVTNDGKINIDDVTFIQKQIAGLI